MTVDAGRADRIAALGRLLRKFLETFAIDLQQVTEVV
jgi:hypothetical protein